MPAGRHLVRLVRANFTPGIEAVEVAAGGVAELTVTLASQVEGFYRAAIAAEPANITLYTELGHYYLIRDRKGEGVHEYIRALEVAAKSAGPDAAEDTARLFNEIGKLKHEQPAVVDALMPAIEALVETLRAAPGRSSPDMARRLKMLGRDDLARRLVGDPVETDKAGFFQLRDMERRATGEEERGNKREAFDLRMELARRYAEMPGDLVKQRRIEHLRRAANLTADPTVQVRIGLDLAALYRDTGEVKRAEEVLLKTRTLLPADQAGSDLFWETAARLAGHYKIEGMPDRAREVYATIIRDNPKPAIQDHARQELGKI